MKSTVLIALMAALGAALAASALAAGDLEISDIQYMPGEKKIIAVVRNTGGAEISSQFSVHFYSGGEKIGESLHTGALPAGGAAALDIAYALGEGTHLLRAAADPGNAVQESNEGNNERALNLAYSPAASLIRVKAAAGQQAAPGSLGFYLGTIMLIAAAGGIIAIAARKASAGGGRGPQGFDKKPGHHQPGHHHAARAGLPARALQGLHAIISGIISGPGPARTGAQRSGEPAAQAYAAQSHAAQEAAAQGIEPAKIAGAHKISDVEKMPRGTRVTFRAQISHYDRIGKEHAYFLNDGSGEIIGFSKEMIGRDDGVVSGVTDTFLEHTVVAVDSVD